ncbi:MAG TPA: peptidylprolyl isomerase [Bacteroidia bacterium]|nr:peptidylprolyl isomerase [Bacteroidia bacterium]
MKKLFPLILLISLFALRTQAQGIDKPQFQIETHRAGNYLGTFNIELFPLIAPLATHNFDSLVTEQFYDSTAFHRVVPGFVIQGGDPNSISGPISTWGQGQPWQPTVPAEFSAVRHVRGILGAARDSDPNSANSQFYICVANATFLDGNYTVYGKVISGMEVVDTIVASPRDANDVPLQKIDMFVTYTGVNDSVPDPPALTSPADGSSGILNTQFFTWTAVPGAVLYTMEFSTDPTFSVIDITANSGTNSLIVTSLGGSTLYYWRVKANNGGHESVPSPVFSFTSATAAATLIYPADTSTGIPVNPVFQWSAVPNATSYTLQVSTSSTFTTASMIYNTAGITDTSMQVNGLNSNSLYYWRIRSADGSQQGFYSTKFTFTTGTSSGVNELSNDFNLLRLYPNPASATLNLEISASQTEPMQLLISDVTGKIVASSEWEMPHAISNKNIDISNLEAGMYFLILQNRSGSLQRRFTVE